VLGLIPLPLNKELNLIVNRVAYLALDRAMRDNLLNNKNVFSLILLSGQASDIRP
jgi:hypothetical protein